MKKVLSVFLALILTLSLAACGPEKVAGGEKVWKVAVLLPYIGDQSYYDAVEAGRKTLDAREEIEATLIEIGTDQAQWESYFMDACESGYDLIVSGYADVEPTLYSAAKMYPDQLFFNFDYSTHEDLDNVFAVTYSLSELGYLAGTLSSLVTTSGMEKANPENKVGVIVGEDSEYMNDFIGSYCQVCAEMGTQVYIRTPPREKNRLWPCTTRAWTSSGKWPEVRALGSLRPRRMRTNIPSGWMQTRQNRSQASLSLHRPSSLRCSKTAAPPWSMRWRS